jgi:hypothetical protein
MKNTRGIMPYRSIVDKPDYFSRSNNKAARPVFGPAAALRSCEIIPVMHHFGSTG